VPPGPGLGRVEPTLVEVFLAAIGGRVSASADVDTAVPA